MLDHASIIDRSRYMHMEMEGGSSSTANTLMSHTNADADRGRPTLKEVECFRNGLVRDPAENNSNNAKNNSNNAQNNLTNIAQNSSNIKY